MPSLIACHECDLLQREVALQPQSTARCTRCGAILYRSSAHSLDRALAFTTAAAVLFILANAFPLVGLEVNGEVVETSLFGASRALYESGMATLAAVVLITTVVAPLIELVALLGLLVPLRFGRVPHGAASVFRTMRAVQPWRMAEVMMLGVLVALVKLSHLAAVIPGIALWSLATLVIMLAASVSTFNPRELWTKIEAAS